MPQDTTETNEAHPWVKILDITTDYAFGETFRIVRARLQHWRFDGTIGDPITRINFERGDSVGVLLYDSEEDTVVLVKQFRYPVYASLSPEQRAGAGVEKAWILEIVAGVVDEGRVAAEVADMELLEEAGYIVKGPMQPITAIYPSPGGTSERILIYLAAVDRLSQVAPGGGAAAEGEDIQVVALPLQKAMAMIADGEINDAKSIIALQHLALRKASLI